ncbi:MAG: pitrilysin family protein [Planctomycetota bacterium]|nr:pitrilysin family protein [Planctomycetota bacterium]
MAGQRRAPARRHAAARARDARAQRGGAHISEHRLRNGMRVLLGERHGDPVVAVVLLYPVGARTESEREAGVSHFLEHMMFKGSAAFGKGAIDLETTVLGGQNNAYTTADHTGYWFEFASDRWEKALEIEADRMRGLTLDPTEFEAEKAVVLEELAMGRDDPWRRLSTAVSAALFGRHPYARPVVGFEDTLRRMSVADMRAYYERFYHPGNATLVVCGDVRPSSALRLVRRHFGGIERGMPLEEADCYRAELSEPEGERRLQVSWDDSVQRLCMAWPTVRVGTDEDYAFDVLSTILTTGRLARLYRRLVKEEGLAVSVSTHNDTRVEAGAFWLFAECVEDRAAEELERAVDEEIERLGSQPASAAELRRARNILLAADAFESETVADLADDLGGFAVDADWRLAVEGAERLARVRPRHVRDAARRFLRPERRVVGWSLPADGGERQA